jgi:hypothetical protein
MTDQELAAIIAQAATADPNKKEGIEAVFELADILKGEPEFAVARTVRGARGAHGFATEFVAQRLIHTAKTTGDPAAAVAWLRKVHTATRGTGCAIKALGGLTCVQPVALAEDVTLLPYLQVPPSHTRDWLSDHENQREYDIDPPHAALTHAGTVEPLFLTAEMLAGMMQSAPVIWFDELDTAALLLALTPRTIPVEVAHWMHYDDPDIDLLCQHGITRQGSADIRLPSLISTPAEVTPESAGGVLTAYRSVQKTEDRSRIRLALERIVRSRSQLHPGNRSIDLAIALEVLFMNVDQGEHSYKVSLRLARLLGGEPPAKRRAFIETRRLYDLRSQMVHTGSAKNDWSVDGEQRSAYDLVEAGDVRCTEAIRGFLALGGIPPDWRDIELS